MQVVRNVEWNHWSGLYHSNRCQVPPSQSSINVCECLLAASAGVAHSRNSTPPVADGEVGRWRVSVIAYFLVFRRFSLHESANSTVPGTSLATVTFPGPS